MSLIALPGTGCILPPPCASPSHGPQVLRDKEPDCLTWDRLYRPTSLRPTTTRSSSAEGQGDSLRCFLFSSLLWALSSVFFLGKKQMNFYQTGPSVLLRIFFSLSLSLSKYQESITFTGFFIKLLFA